MLMQIIMLAVGFVLLIAGANWLVDGGSGLAKKYNVSDLAIGLTIVAFGTSAPELIVNAYASFQNHPEIVFGNIIGSNNFNLFIILGITGLITPMVVKSSTVWKEIPISFFAIILLFVLVDGFRLFSSQVLGFGDGTILLLMFFSFLYYVYKQLKTEDLIAEVDQKNFSLIKIWGLIVVGLSALVGGGKLVVSNVIELSETLGVSEDIIGLTIVAAGTSLPELTTSIVASVKKNNDIAIGNIIGSNIFNIFFILSISSIIAPIRYDPKFNIDLYFLAGGTLFLFVAMFTGQKKKLDRWEAAILLLAFIVYSIYRI